MFHFFEQVIFLKLYKVAFYSHCLVHLYEFRCRKAFHCLISYCDVMTKNVFLCIFSSFILPLTRNKKKFGSGERTAPMVNADRVQSVTEGYTSSRHHPIKIH